MRAFSPASYGSTPPSDPASAARAQRKEVGPIAPGVSTRRMNAAA
jgi:hypothetical protein